MKDIFISYSRLDIEIARDIKQRIETVTKKECWRDMEGIPSGAPNYKDVIASAINEVQVFVLLLSENSMKSENVKMEIDYARAKGKRVVPVNIDGAEPTDWFIFTFSGADVIDYSNEDQRQKFFRDIVRWCSPTLPEPPYIEGPTTTSSTTVTTAAYVLQYALWGILGIVALRITFNPKGALYIGRSVFPPILDLCIAGTLVATYFMSKGKQWAFYVVCALDLLEIYLVCKMGYTAFYKHPGGGYKRIIYQNLWGLGSLINRHSMVYAYVLLAIPAALHIAAMKLLWKTSR